MFRRSFNAGRSVCLVESRVIVCLVEPETENEKAVLKFASRYRARLAFIERLPDGRELIVLDRTSKFRR